MTDYTKTTDFAAKDSLTSGDTNKIIRGSEFDEEFNNIATAIATKSDKDNVYLYPKDFGAVGDGATDDTTAFNSLVLEAQTVSDAGKTPVIDLNGRTYLIKGSIKFRRPITMLCYGATLKADASGTVATDFDEILDGDGNGSGKYCFFDVEEMEQSTFLGNLIVVSTGGTTKLLGGPTTYPDNLVAFSKIRGNVAGPSLNGHFDSLDIARFDRAFYVADDGAQGIYPFTRSNFGRLDIDRCKMAFDWNGANGWDETFIGVLRITNNEEPSNLFNFDLNVGNLFLNGNKTQHEVSGTAVTLATTSGSTAATCNVADAFSVGDAIAIEDAESYGTYLITKVAAVSGTSVTLEDNAGATAAAGAVYYAAGGLKLDQAKLIANKLFVESTFYTCIHGFRLTSIYVNSLKVSSGSFGAYKGHPIVIEHEYSNTIIGKVSRKENGINSANGNMVKDYLYYGLVETSGREPQHYGRISVIENKTQLESDGITALATGAAIYSGSTTATSGKTNLVVDYTDQTQTVDPFSNVIQTFTPVVADAASAGNEATGSFEGAYSVNGNLVTLSIRLVDIDTTGMTGANPLYVRNLPYPAVDAPTALFPFTGSIGQMNRVTFTNVPVPTIRDNQNYIQFYEASSGASVGNLTVADIDSGLSDIYFSISYLIDL